MSEIEGRQRAFAKAYASGRPLKDIAEENGWSIAYPGYCASKAGLRLRRAGGRYVETRRANGTIKWVRA